MKIKIPTLNDTIKIDKSFVTGKDRIAINGNVVFEGKLSPNSTQKFDIGKRKYFVESKVVNKLTKTVAIHLVIYENAEVVHKGIYDQTGKLVEDEKDAKRNGVLQACGAAGAATGIITMMILNLLTGVVPGGAIGGGIGAGVGYGIGYAIGRLILNWKS